MTFYAAFLTALGFLFALSAGVLAVLSVVQANRGRRRRAAAYLGLALVAGLVAAAFFVVRRLV